MTPLRIATLTAGTCILTLGLQAGVASAHEAAAFCIEGTDTYEVVALTSEPGFTWTGDEVSWVATWADGVTDEGPAPEGCTTPSSTTTTTTVPVTTSPAETTVPPPSTEPGTTVPAASSTTTSGPPGVTSVPPSGPTTSVASSTRLPATGNDAFGWGFFLGAALTSAGFLLIIIDYVRKRNGNA